MVLPATSALCAVITLFFGGSPLVYSPAPRGNCRNCCKIHEPKDIKFQLYTRLNKEIPEMLYVSDIPKLERSNLNKTEPLIIYVHGFSESAPGGVGQSSQEMRDGFLERGNYNVILVDWSPLAALPWYISSVNNGPRVGRYIARFIKFLIQSGYPLEKIHLIGFSLGAEIAGFCGKVLKEWGFFLPRITGLDPALPLYVLAEPLNLINENDAEFVDIIHTDGGVLGYPWKLGDADFFPNGGSAQPGCIQQEIAKNRWLSIIIGCSHQRAWEYFKESLKRPEAFLANDCIPKNSTIDYKTKTADRCDPNMKAYMGINANPKLRGNYYLSTNSEKPFGKNFPISKR